MTGEIARMVVETFQKPALEAPTHLELSAREMEILALVAKGQTNKQIGPALGISYDTVRKPGAKRSFSSIAAANPRLGLGPPPGAFLPTVEPAKPG